MGDNADPWLGSLTDTLVVHSAVCHAVCSAVCCAVGSAACNAVCSAVSISCLIHVLPPPSSTDTYDMGYLACILCGHNVLSACTYLFM